MDLKYQRSIKNKDRLSVVTWRRSVWW